MNRLFLIFIIAFATVCAFTSCDREALNISAETGTDNPESTVQGQLNLASLRIGVNVDAQSEVSTRSGVDVSNFIVYIYVNGDTDPLREWVYNAMPELFSLPIGDYRIEVWSHIPEEAAWEKPYYFATKDFTITRDALTDIGTLTCRLNNIKTTVAHADDFKALFGDDVKVTIVANGKGTLDFSKDETRAGFFKKVNEDSNVLTATISGTIAGSAYTKTGTFPGVKAGEHRKFTFSYNSSSGDIGDGGAPNFNIDINIDCDIVDINHTVIPEGEDGIDDFPTDPTEPTNPDDNADAPTIVGTNFGGSPFDINTPQTVNGRTELTVTLTAPKGMTNVDVTIDSNTLTAEILGDVGLTENFDLAYPGEYEAGLKGLGFPTGSDVIGQNELLFNITQFTPLLGIYGAGTHNFIIKVTDQDGVSTTKTLILITE